MIKQLSLTLFLLVCIAVHGDTKDPIPYQPDATQHGPNFDIPDSQWKRAADARIDTYRKADLELTIVDANGKPLKDASVHVELQRHAFHWGAVMGPDFLTNPKSKTLQSYFLKYFNAAGSGSGLKPKACPIEPCKENAATFLHRAAEKQMEWFKKHDIPVRGHALAWEGESWLAPHMRWIYNNPDYTEREKGEKMLSRQLEHAAHAFEKWDVFCWDVVNEPRDNTLVNDMLPHTDTFVETFRRAADMREKLGRGTKLYYNENQIISFVKKVGSFEKNMAIYKSRIQDLLDADIPLDGIGFQYRVRRYVPPEEIYRRLGEFEEFNLPYQATEFEVKPMLKTEQFSPVQKKQMVAELLTVFFSHPNATGLWCWSFMDNKKGTLPDALFSHDGELRPEAEQWIKMMEEDFNTDAMLRLNRQGRVAVRGFKGSYDITVKYGSKKKSFTASLLEDTKLKLICD